MMHKSIPEDAACVYEGPRWRVWQWQQKGFNGEYELYEIVQRFPGVQGIMIADDKIILPNELHPRRDEKKLSLFGGGIGHEEDPKAGMERELLEEAGMKGDCVFRMDLSKGGSIIRDERYFIIKNAVKIQDPKYDPGENIELVSMSFEQFLQEILKPSFRNASFGNYIIRNYILPGKTEDLKKILFGG